MQRRHKGMKSNDKQGYQGKEFWKSRLHPCGESLGKETKVDTHRKERRKAKHHLKLNEDCHDRSQHMG